MMEEENLWGVDRFTPFAPLLPPKKVLETQAAMLPQLTEGFVFGIIVSGRGTTWGRFKHTFTLQVPELDNYSRELLYVEHNEEMYPCWMMADGADRATRCETPDELKSCLKIILTNERTTRLVQLLYTQAKNS